MPYQLNAFLSYSHKDEEHKIKFLSHFSALVRTKNIFIWEDSKINGGDKWDASIKNNLSNAHLIILLLSANFFSSDYIYDNELQLALELQNKNKALLIPVMLTNYSLTDMPIATIQTLPSGPRFIEDIAWKNKDDAWVNVIEGIRKSIKKIEDVQGLWDPVKRKDNIIEILLQHDKLEEACNKTIDFARDFGSPQQNFLALLKRTRLSEIEQAGKSDSKPTEGKIPFLDILNARENLRMEIYFLLDTIIIHLLKQVS